MDDDGDEKDESKRRTRNLSEKKRRDQFNSLISELSSMITNNTRKMDKSTVLRSTISFLKNHNEITVRSRAHDIHEDWKPTFLSNDEFTYLVLESLEGFMLVFTSSGQINYVSESISSLLGHNPAEIVNKSLFELIHEDDQSMMCALLHNPGNITDSMQAIKDNEVHFQCHFRRGNLDLKEEDIYELVQFFGHYRTNIEQLHKDDAALHVQKENDTRFLFVCTGRLYNPQLVRDVSLVDTTRNEFTSRHSLEWKFLFLDHRAPPIIGYLPFEVLGTSGYDYYHFDDLEKVVTCHEALMQKGELTSCYYRFLTKGQEWIWLQTRYYISYHQWNSKPEFVVCTHRVVSYMDIANNTKQEGTEIAVANDVDVNRSVVEEVAADEPVTKASTSFVCEANDTFINSYQSLLQGCEEVFTFIVYYSDDTCPLHAAKPRLDLAALIRHYNQPIAENRPSGYVNTVPFGLQPVSVKSVSAGSANHRMSLMRTPSLAGSWPQPVAVPGSNNASVSGESRSSLRNCKRDTHKDCEQTLVPQNKVDVQHSEPAPFVDTITVPGILPLPLPSLPVSVSQDQAQLQEQLQKKHEELQQMILRQQEELRRVKEQLLLARLGILQPIINMAPAQASYMNPEEIRQLPRLPAPQDYDRGNSNSSYHQRQLPHSDCNHLPP